MFCKMKNVVSFLKIAIALLFIRSFQNNSSIMKMLAFVEGSALAKIT